MSVSYPLLLLRTSFANIPARGQVRGGAAKSARLVICSEQPGGEKRFQLLSLLGFARGAVQDSERQPVRPEIDRSGCWIVGLKGGMQ
jgi:hypothetical protein